MLRDSLHCCARNPQFLGQDFLSWFQGQKMFRLKEDSSLNQFIHTLQSMLFHPHKMMVHYVMHKISFIHTFLICNYFSGNLVIIFQNGLIFYTGSFSWIHRNILLFKGQMLFTTKPSTLLKNLYFPSSIPVKFSEILRMQKLFS